jgi:hypothetical protein
MMFIGDAECLNLTFVDVHTLTCTTSPSNLNPAAVVAIKVDNITHLSLTTFAYSDALLVPVLTSISPKIGAIAGGVKITVTGDNFIQAGASQTISVLIAGVPCTNVQVLSATSLTAIVPARQNSDQKVAPVVVVLDGFQSNALSFTYGLGVAEILSITPESGTWFQSTSLTIIASGITGDFSGLQVSILGNAAPVSSVNLLTNNRISIVTVAPPVDVTFDGATPFAAPVVITNLGIQTAPLNFYYTPNPYVRAISPDHGKAGTTMRVYGKNFDADSQVLLGGDKCAAVHFIDSETLECKIPNEGGDGAKLVAVIDKNLNSNSNITFEYKSAALSLTARLALITLLIASGLAYLLR